MKKQLPEPRLVSSRDLKYSLAMQHAIKRAQTQPKLIAITSSIPVKPK